MPFFNVSYFCNNNNKWEINNYDNKFECWLKFLFAIHEKIECRNCYVLNDCKTMYIYFLHCVQK